MPVQYPVFTTQEQIDRYKSYAQNTLFPYSYATFLNTNATDMPTADGAVGSYNTIKFQADNNLAISDISLNIAISVSLGAAVTSSFFAVALSYSPIFQFYTALPTAGVFATPTIPGDSGNEIFRYFVRVPNPNAPTTGFRATVNANIFERFEPYNYLLKFNQFLYIHIAADATSVSTTAGFVEPSIILHTLQTGLKI